MSTKKPWSWRLEGQVQSAQPWPGHPGHCAASEGQDMRRAAAQAWTQKVGDCHSASEEQSGTQPGGVGGTHSRRMLGRAGWWEAQMQDAGADGDEVWLPQNWPFQQTVELT